MCGVSVCLRGQLLGVCSLLVCACIWKPELNPGVMPREPFNLFFQALTMELGVKQVVEAGWPVNPRVPPVFASPSACYHVQLFMLSTQD